MFNDKSPILFKARVFNIKVAVETLDDLGELFKDNLIVKYV